MPKIYSWRFHVRSYEMDVNWQVSPPTFLHYLEEGAIQASAASGYTYQWYNENKRVWVVRKMTIRYFDPVTSGEELELRTWVSDFRRVQSHREYDLRRASDGARVVRGRANWVFINTETMQIARIPNEAIQRFAPDGELETLDTGITEPTPISESLVHTEERRVQHYEIDAQGHVNNAVYLAWSEQAIMNGLRDIGWPPERFSSSDFKMRPLANEIEYFRSALDDDPITITSYLAAAGGDRAAWHVE